MLLISHDLGVMPYVSSRVAIIHEGKLIEDGPMDDVFDRPKSDYACALLAVVPEAGLPAP